MDKKTAAKRRKRRLEEQLLAATMPIIFGMPDNPYPAEEELPPEESDCRNPSCDKTFVKERENHNFCSAKCYKEWLKSLK